MAYQFTNDDGHAQIGGTPAAHEVSMGRSIDDRQLGELCSFEELYGDEEGDD